MLLWWLYTQSRDHFVYMGPANGRQRCNVTSSLIGWAYTQNDSWQNAHNSHPIIGWPRGWDIGWLWGVQCLIYVLPGSLKWSLSYHVKLDHIVREYTPQSIMCSECWLTVLRIHKINKSGHRFNIKYHLNSVGNPIVGIRWLSDHLKSLKFSINKKHSESANLRQA